MQHDEGELAQRAYTGKIRVVEAKLKRADELHAHFVFILKQFAAGVES
jgi:hypothetical protein